MNHLPMLGYCSAAVVSGFIAKRGHNDLKRIDLEKEEMLKNIITTTKFENTNPGLFYHKVVSECGEVKIYKQENVTMIHNVPITTINLNLNQNIVQETKTMFNLFSTFITDDTFGSPNLIPSKRFIGNVKCDKILPSQNSILRGNELQEKLMKEYNIHKKLDSDTIYEYEYKSFQGKNLYLSGKKISDKFVYNCVNTCPLSVVDEEYQVKESVGYIMKYGGIASIIGFGIASISEFLSKT